MREHNLTYLKRYNKSRSKTTPWLAYYLYQKFFHCSRSRETKTKHSEDNKSLHGSVWMQRHMAACCVQHRTKFIYNRLGMLIQLSYAVVRKKRIFTTAMVSSTIQNCGRNLDYLTISGGDKEELGFNHTVVQSSKFPARWFLPSWRRKRHFSKSRL
jgi:hypothetical protein